MDKNPVDPSAAGRKEQKRSYRNAQGKLVLPQVTLCAMTSVNVRETLKAMEYSCRGIEFAMLPLPATAAKPASRLS